jgi:DNA/RNA-binding domain of Phe-tRNA-synthetase-like protein
MSFTRIATAPGLTDRLPGVSVYGALLQGGPAAPVDFTAEWQQLHARWSGRTKADVAADARVAAYVAFYQRLGLNPKKNPPSVQNLIQRFLLGPSLEKVPRIHPVVDAVNVAAVETCIPLGVFDAGQVEGELGLGITAGGEPFQALGSDAAIALEPGIVVLRDRAKVLSWFCYRDSTAQKVTEATRAVWLLGCEVPGIAQADVTAALERAQGLLQILSFAKVSS